MSSISIKRPLAAIAITSTIIGSLTTGFIVPNLARAETIIVESCDPGDIELRSGEYLTCIDPSDSGGGAGDGDSAGDPSDDGGGRGGVRRPQRPNAAAERSRKQRCKKCQAASQQCQAQATLARQTCLNNAEAQARDRCNPLSRGARTVTAWGCSLDDLAKGDCSVAESPWNEARRWGYKCEGQPPVQRVCEGVGVENCVTSWRINHPSGSKTMETDGEFTIEFAGVGFLANQQITETFTWNGQVGYLSACESLAMQLNHGCTGRENACYQAYSCTDSDLQ